MVHSVITCGDIAAAGRAPGHGLVWSAVRGTVPTRCPTAVANRSFLAAMRDFLDNAEPVRRTILLVEDDAAIRYLFTEVLHNQGYYVIAAEDGELGLEIARARIASLDAVITDSRMPRLEGPELVAAIRALRPEIPILVVSGGVDAAAPSSDPATRYIAKPISPQKLIQELRRILRSASR